MPGDLRQYARVGGRTRHLALYGDHVYHLTADAHGTRAIRMDQWRNLVVPLPPYPQQHAIAAFLDSETTRIDALINRIKRAIDHLKEFRTALISAAVTGKIEVRTPSAEATAGQGSTR